MNKIIIEKNNFKNKKLFNMLNDYLYSYLKNKNTYIFDIHNTIEYGKNNDIDKDIFNFIKKNYKETNVILLSFDGNNKRIQFNNDILDEYSQIFTKIPKIFIKKRKKHYIISYIYKLLKSKYTNYNNKIYFIDDNYRNIIDSKKIIKYIPNFFILHYNAHSTHKEQIEKETVKTFKIE